MTNWTISFAPLIPYWALAALFVPALLMIALLFWQNGLRIFWRCLAFAVLLLALANPLIETRDSEDIADIGVIVIDESASQTIKPRMKQIKQAEAKLKALFQKTSNLEIRTVRIGAKLGGSGTRILSALKSALREIPPERFAGAIIVSDGQIHDIGARTKLAIKGPVHMLLTGRSNEQDRRLVIEHASKFGIVGEDITFTFRVDEDGGALKQATSVDVIVKHDGKQIKILKASIGISIKLKLKLEHAGLNVVELKAAPGEKELTMRNNSAMISVQGIRHRLRVLLISGEPHQGERTWRNLLKADASVDLVHFTILRPPEKQDGTPIRELSLIAFPTRQLFSEKLHEFDLVIFDRYQRRGVLPLVYLSNVAEYVDKGGAVLAAAGPAYASPFSIYRTPLAAILPGIPTGSVITEPYRASVTKKGFRHPVTANLQGSGNKTPKWGRWFQLIEAEAVGGVSLLSGARKKPLLVLRRQGKGRVALLLSDNAWLWARGFDGGGPYAELLRRLAHWLMKEPDLEEERLTARNQANALIIERRTMGDKADPVKVIAPSGKISEVKLQNQGPGLFRGRIDTKELGLYRLESGKLSTVAAIGLTDLREWSDVRSTGKILKKLVDAHEGGIHRLWRSKSSPMVLPQIRFVNAGRRMSGNGWLAFRRNHITRTLALHHIPLFSLLIVIAALLSLLGLVWYREGH